MAVRRRVWHTKKTGERRESWIVDYSDQQGERHIETFSRKRDADAFRAQVAVAVRAGTHTPVSKSITVQQASEDWIRSVAVEGREAPWRSTASTRSTSTTASAASSWRT
jgi:integrase